MRLSIPEKAEASRYSRIIIIIIIIIIIVIIIIIIIYYFNCFFLWGGVVLHYQYNQPKNVAPFIAHARLALDM